MIPTSGNRSDLCGVREANTGEKVDVDPKTGEAVNGKLYLNNSRRALDILNKDQSGTIAKAKSNWPTVKDKAL